MNKLISITLFFLLTAGFAAPAEAQEGPSRAEFECLLMSNSSAAVERGQSAEWPSFHHVWLPGLTYGRFESGGLNLLYEIEGTGKEVVVVVHGGPGQPHDYFHPLLSSLSKYMRLVYFDRRADMLSSRSSHETAPIDEMADDINALRRKLGLERVTLLAHSFGGAIALNYALRYPANTKRLVLVGTSAMIESPAEVERRIVKGFSPQELSAYRSSEGASAAATPCERVRKQYRALYPHYFHRLPDAKSLDRGVYSAYFDALARKLVLASDEGGFDVRAYLDRIKVPALVLAGRHDVVTPLEQATEMAEAMPRSKLVVMENSGHFPFFEENYMFTEWVRQFVLATADLRDDRITAAPNSRLGNSGGSGSGRAPRRQQ
jgi:proline iminopeptidase